MPYPATPRTWVAGDVLTAAQLNAEIRDALLGAFPLGAPDAAWTGFTPTLTQSGAVSKIVTYGRYQRVGRIIVAKVFLSCSGSGTAANPVVIGLPVTAAWGQDTAWGVGEIFDQSANLVYRAIARFNSTTTVQLYGTHTVNNGPLGSTDFTAALASGDLVEYCVTYESAT